MRRHLRFAAVLLPSVLIVTACAATQPPPLPEQVTRIVYPPMPPTKCARLPDAPDVTASDNEWALYKNARDTAGDDCRDKLDAVDGVVSGWPK